MSDEPDEDEPRFGDDDPEDAWDPGDPLPELLENICRRVAAVVDDLRVALTRARGEPDG